MRNPQLASATRFANIYVRQSPAPIPLASRRHQDYAGPMSPRFQEDTHPGVLNALHWGRIKPEPCLSPEPLLRNRIPPGALFST